jgi:hypothetical protein
MSPTVSRQSRLRSDVLQAWRDQLATQHDVALAHGACRREPELLSRFGDCYQRLHALPRRWRRALKRRLRRSLAGVALLLALGQGAALAATITVDGTTCTLADAITAANTDTAVGGCPAGSGDDILNLTNDITLTSELPSIVSGITIEGNGRTIQRDASALDFGILSVGERFGGYGDVTLNDATVAGGAGAGVFVGLLSFVEINNSTISGNSGAGVDVYISAARINNSTISGNSGDGVYMFYSSGGIDNTISNSTISGNSGDGINLQRLDSKLVVSNSTISGNSGFGLRNEADAFSTDVSIDHSTISGNLGGAIRNYADPNASDVLVDLERCIISGNSSVTGVEISNQGSEATVVADDYNLFGDDAKTNAQAFSGFTPGATDVSATSDGTNPTALTDILDTTLRDNGGPTETLALVEGSPAIDASPDDAGCPDTDQRSVPRPQGAACDIGAYEFQVAAAAVGGSVTGMTPTTIICENKETEQRVSVPLPDDSTWNCEEAGLVFGPGDRIGQRVTGVADGAASLGGTVTGVSGQRARCLNRSTGQRVVIDLNGENTWDCEGAGLQVRTGDRVNQVALGIAEQATPPPDVLTVPVDIIEDRVNLASDSGISVAILTDASFDALQVDVSTVRFGPDEAPVFRKRVEDSDGDGDLDLRVRFRLDETGIACGDTEATLTGATAAGQLFTGTDAIEVICN